VGLPVDDWRPAANALLCDTPSVRSADVLATCEEDESRWTAVSSPVYRSTS